MKIKTLGKPKHPLTYSIKDTSIKGSLAIAQMG